MEQLFTMLDAYPQLKPFIALGMAMTVLIAPFYFVLGIIRPPLNTLFSFLSRQIYREISIHVSDPEYAKFNLWIDKNAAHTSFKRQYKVVSSDGSSDVESEDSAKPSKLVAGYGSIFVKSPGMPYVLVTRAKEEGKQIFQVTETLTIRVYSIRASKLEQLFSDIISTREQKGPFVYKSGGDSWWQKIGSPKDTLAPIGSGASVFIDDLTQFIENKESYKSRTVPYKRGYLLFGPPGTGKSSLLAWVSKHFDMNIYLLDSTGVMSFGELMPDVKKGSMIVIEDIDMTIAGVGRQDTLTTGEDPQSSSSKPANVQTNATHSQSEIIREFLNSLDGITRFEDSIIVITTNKPNVLDPALLRPGRIDCQIEIGLLKADEQIEHYNAFYSDNKTSRNAMALKDRTFAELQYICNSNMDDQDAAWRDLCGLHSVEGSKYNADDHPSRAIDRHDAMQEGRVASYDA